MKSKSPPLPEVLAPERVLTAHQAAEFLSISTTTFRRLYWAGRTPAAVRLSDRRLGWRVRDLVDHLAQPDTVA